MFTGLLPHGSLRRIVANNTVSQLFGRAVSSVSIVIVSLFIANRYGPVGYGDFVKITTYVAFFYLFADYGLNAIFVQRNVEKPADGSNGYISSWRVLLGLRLFMSLVLVGVALGIVALFPSGYGQGYTLLVRYGIYLLIPVIIAQSVTTTTNAYFQKILRYDLATIAQNAGSFIMVGVAVLLSFLTPVSGPLLGVISVFSGSVVTTVVALLLVSSRLRTIRPIVHVQQYRSYFLTATPLGLALIFNLIYFHSDSVVLTLTRSTREVGIYGLAYKVFELPLVLPIFFMNSVYPLMLKASRRNGDARENIFFRSFQFLLASSIVVAIGIWVFAPLVTYIRPEFVESIAPLRVLLLGLPVFFISALFMWFMIAQKQQGALLWIHGIAMVMNIFGNLWFIPYYGYMAAAWITVVSELFVLVVSGIVVRQKRLNTVTVENK